MRRERKELPEAFFGDSQEEKETVRTVRAGIESMIVRGLACVCGGLAELRR